MVDVLFIAGMALIGLVAMVLTAQPAKKGRFGLPLTIVSLLGGLLVVLVYPITGDFLQLYAIGLVGVLPAFLGSLAGFVVGWLIWRRRQKLSK